MDAYRGSCGPGHAMETCKAIAHAQLAVVVAAPDLKEAQGSGKINAGI